MMTRYARSTLLLRMVLPPPVAWAGVALPSSWLLECTAAGQANSSYPVLACSGWTLPPAPPSRRLGEAGSPHHLAFPQARRQVGPHYGLTEAWPPPVPGCRGGEGSELPPSPHPPAGTAASLALSTFRRGVLRMARPSLLPRFAGRGMGSRRLLSSILLGRMGRGRPPVSAHPVAKQGGGVRRHRRRGCRRARWRGRY